MESPGRPQPWTSRDAGLLAAYLLATALLQAMAQAFRLEPGTVVWYGPPALTMAFALAAPPRLRGAVFFASLPYLVFTQARTMAALPSLVICFAHGAVYGFGIRLLLRQGFDPALRRGKDLALLLLFFALAPLLFAVPAGLALSTYFKTDFGTWSHRIPRLWLEDAVGLLGLAPPLLLFALPPWMGQRGEEGGATPPLRVLEVLLQGMALAGVSTLVLLQPSGTAFPFAYLGFLPLLWVDLRWGLRGASMGVLLFITSMGGQYVALGLPSEGLVDLQLLLIVMTATALVVGNLVDARHEHRRTLVHQGLQLATLLRGTGSVPFEMEAKSGRCTMLGRGALPTTGHSMEAWQRDPFWAGVVDPLHLPRLQAYFAGLLDGSGAATVEVPLQSAGEPRWIEVAGSALGVRDHVGGFFHDISARKAMEQHLQASEAHFRQLVDQSLIPTAVYQEGCFVYANDATLALLGYRREALLGLPVNTIIHTEELANSMEMRTRAMRGESLHAVERRLLRKDGSIVVVDLLTIACQHEGRPAAQVLAVDLTARKAAEESLKERLKEKELLIREIHHRVKNNLQVVSSLLRLQANLHPSPELGRALEEAQGRIHAIAAVHQRLHSGPTLAAEDLRDYLTRLVAQLVQTFASAPALIRTQVEVEPLALGADQLVPLGLIVHELVLNALRHAFVPGQGGTIVLELCAVGDQAELRIADDGTGLPRGLDPFQSGALGFQMVRALADQLKGRLEIQAGPGTAFRLRFPIPVPHQP
jgi:PAS domain S-box-containing protein